MKKRGISKVTRKTAVPKKLNPFELKYNRAKHKILGTKTASASCGAPGLSKKKAFENRAKTLAVEWKERGKRNKVIDQRIGEGDGMVAGEEPISKRFAAERLKMFKANKSELAGGGEEQLTHRGRALTEVEKYDRTMLSDEEDDEEGGNIGADVVAAAHFGGGETSSTAETVANRRRDVLAELIVKTKQQRYDKKLARDEREDATERLDEKWSEMLQTGAMNSFVRSANDKKSIRRENDEYDSLFFELQTDTGKRGEASERQKTAEELAEEEREKLIRQEKARLARMNQDGAEKLGKKAKNSDSEKDEGFMVKYDSSGTLINAEKIKRGRIKVVRIDSESSDEENASDSDEENEDEEIDFDEMAEDAEEIDLPSSSSQNGTANAEARSKPGSEELPFVIEMPRNYGSLKKLLDIYNGSDCEVIITRLIKLYHPTLREGNKSRLSRLFLLLLRYYDELSKEGEARADSFGHLARGLYALMKFNIEYSARCMRALLRQQHTLHARAPRTMFTFRAVAFLKLVSTLYPLSDAYHPVASPTLAFACRLISTVRICSIKDAARVLILLRILSAFVEESKRYLPEVIAFLHGVFLVAVENEDVERSPTATFPVSLPHRRMLLVTNKCLTTEMPSQLDSTQVFSDDVDSFEENDRNRICILSIAVNVLCRFSMIYSNSVSFAIIFRPFLDLLSRLPRDRYPDHLLSELSALESFINAQSSKNPLKQLQRPVKEKKMLALLEPRFEEGYDLEKAHYQKNGAKKSKKVEIKQLTKKYKKELRGTVRELRRDNQFLNREKRREMVENNRARKQKTKWLISTLQGQESEYKKNAYMKHKL